MHAGKSYHHHSLFFLIFSLFLNLLRAAERFLSKMIPSNFSYIVCICVCVCVYVWREIAAVKHQTRAHEKIEEKKKTLKGYEIVRGNREQVCVTYCAEWEREVFIGRMYMSVCMWGALINNKTTWELDGCRSFKCVCVWVSFNNI